MHKHLGAYIYNFITSVDSFECIHWQSCVQKMPAVWDYNKCKEKLLVYNYLRDSELVKIAIKNEQTSHS